MNNLILRNLRLVNFRNFTDLALQFDQLVTFIVGDNGAGKTSILEALNVATTGKSFRTNTAYKIIKKETDLLRIELNFEASEINYSRDLVGNKKVVLDGKVQTNFLQVSKSLPLFVMEGDFFRAFHLGSSYRQRVINWTMFHVEHSFAHLWQTYNRALMQRNNLLKQQVNYDNLVAWDLILADAGTKINKIRTETLSELYPLFLTICTRLHIDSAALKLEFLRGWQENVDLFLALKNNYLKDKWRGYSGVGPHRFDVNFTKIGVPVRDILSRGQQKIILLAWGLACAQYLYLKQQVKCVFLLDDLGSELDSKACTKVIDYLGMEQHQIIVTILSLHDLKIGAKHAKINLDPVENKHVSVNAEKW